MAKLSGAIWGSVSCPRNFDIQVHIQVYSDKKGGTDLEKGRGSFLT